MTTVDECAQAILNEWRQVEPASAHVLAHMAARIAAARFGDAVVRPTRPDSATAMRDEIAVVLASWESWDDETRRIGGPLADLIADNLDVWNGFGVSAVVRPTRDQLVEFLRDEWLSAGFASPEEVIDALISGRFVAVSDSQETLG